MGTFTLISQPGSGSVLTADYYPPIKLETDSAYGLGLLAFYSYNSIFNIDETNNRFSYRVNVRSPPTHISLKPGAYEINEIYRAILKQMGVEKEDEAVKIFTLIPNNNTLKCEIWSKYVID